MFVDNDMAQQQQQQPVDQLCGLQTWISSMDCDSIDDSFNTGTRFGFSFFYHIDFFHLHNWIEKYQISHCQ